MRVLTPRQSERLPLEAGAIVRIVAVGSEPATLVDISVEGCSLNLRPRFLQVGRAVLVRMEGLESLVGQVRWVKGRNAGILFERPLHVAVVEHIVRTHPRIECAKIA